MAAGRERRTSVVGPEHDGTTIQRHLHDALGLSLAVARGLVAAKPVNCAL